MTEPSYNLARLRTLRSDLDSSRAILRRETLRALASGHSKTKVAEAAGITRPTLDAWLKEEKT